MSVEVPEGTLVPTHDPRVPALAMLLDDDATTRWLRGAVGAVRPVGEARVRHLRHKPGTSVQAWVVIEAPDGGASWHAVVLGTAVGGEVKRAKLARSASRRGTWAIGDDGGADRAAAGSGPLALAVGHAADRPLGALAPLLLGGATTLRHNPGRRWVGRSDSGDLLKVSAAGRETTAVRAAALLAAHGVPTPGVLEHGDGLLRLEWWQGRTLEVGFDVASSGAPGACGAEELPQDVLLSFGALVAALHAVPVAGGSPLGHVTSHGDLSPDQVLRRPDGSLALLDLDRFTVAPPAADLGSVLGDLLARVSTGSPGADLDAVGERAWSLLLPVLDGYRSAGGRVGDAAVLAAGARSLLTRVAEPWRRREPDAVEEAGRRRDLALRLPELLATPRRRAAPAPAPAPARWSPPDRVTLDGTVHEVLRAWPRGRDHALLELGAADGSSRGAEAFSGEPAARKRLAASPGARLLASPAKPGWVLVHPREVDAALPALAERLALGESVVVHRPGRRAVLRGPGPNAPFVKVLRRGRAADATGRHRALAAVLAVSGADVRTAEIVWEDGDALATGGLPGVTLLRFGQDAVGDGAHEAAWSAVGRLLRALRAHDGEADGEATPSIPVHDARAEHATTLAWLEPVLAWGLLPDVAPAEVAAALAPLLREAPEPRALLHRDLHDQQVLVAPDGSLGLLDLDTVARGESALDLANLLAHLDLRQRQGLLTPERRRRAHDALLASADPGPATLARLPAHLVAARLRLAAVYAVRPRWRSLASGLLRDTLR